MYSLGYPRTHNDSPASGSTVLYQYQASLFFKAKFINSKYMRIYRTFVVSSIIVYLHGEMLGVIFYFSHVSVKFLKFHV